MYSCLPFLQLQCTVVSHFCWVGVQLSPRRAHMQLQIGHGFAATTVRWRWDLEFCRQPPTILQPGRYSERVGHWDAYKPIPLCSCFVVAHELYTARILSLPLSTAIHTCHTAHFGKRGQRKRDVPELYSFFVVGGSVAGGAVTPAGKKRAIAAKESKGHAMDTAIRKFISNANKSAVAMLKCIVPLCSRRSFLFMCCFTRTSRRTFVSETLAVTDWPIIIYTVMYSFTH